MSSFLNGYWSLPLDGIDLEPLKGKMAAPAFSDSTQKDMELKPIENEPTSAEDDFKHDHVKDGFAETNAFGDDYRNYENSARQDTVSNFYWLNHQNQNVDFVRDMHTRWLAFNKGEFTIMEVIEMLDELIDDSDPDNEEPNSIHDFQTAERIRAQWPEHDWFHLIGLLHDLGKIMALEPVAGKDKLEQWAVVGDTHAVGCEFSDKCVFPQFFKGSKDEDHPVYSTKMGIYEPGCGISNLMLSWGHDEYMYQVLKENGCTIPEDGLNMIRLHSFYPWHTGNAYKHFEAPGDEETLMWVREFNKFDLYSKGDAIPDVHALKPYYQGLCEKYNIGGKLRW